MDQALAKPLRFQDFGHDPLAVRTTDHYRQEYVEAFVEKWDDLIDWDARAESESGFFIQVLKAAGKRKILDVSTGTGFHSVQLLRAGFERLSPAPGTGRVAVGLSAWVEHTAMSGALDEARHAVRLAELRDLPVSVVTSDDVTSHVLLLGTVPDDVRRAFATRVIGPVIGYDAEHGSDLLPTLEAFLRTDGSWLRCAELLHLHVNTVRYRISRVEEVTGRDLNRLEDRVDMLLALRSLPLKH